jgi:hypothetical protein
MPRTLFPVSSARSPGNLDIDAERCRKGSTALALHAVEQRAQNADVLTS